MAEIINEDQLHIDCDRLRAELILMAQERNEMLRTTATLMEKNAEYERKERADAPYEFQIGDRVRANNTAGFHVGMVGTVQFVEPCGVKESKIWVLRDGSSGPVFYIKSELTLIKDKKDGMVSVVEPLTETEMVIVNHAIAMLNQIGLSGAEADKIVYGDDSLTF